MGVLRIVAPQAALPICLADALIQQLKREADDRGDNILDATHHLVVMPTQRVITYCAASLAKQAGGLHPPQMVTMEQLWNRLGYEVPLPDGRSLTPDLVASAGLLRLWLTSHLAQKDYRHLHLGHEGELLQLFTEWQETGDPHAAIARLEEVIAQDIYRNDQHLGALMDRAREVKTAYQALEDFLNNHGLVSQPVAEHSKAQALATNAATALSGYAHIWLAGFTSTKSHWLPALVALLALPQTQMWLAEAPPHSPLGALGAALSPAASAVETQPLPTNQRCHQLQTWYLPLGSPREEAQHAVALARYFQQSGLAASQIAVVVPDEGTYAEPLRLAFAASELPYNLALARPLVATSFGLALQSLATWAFQGDPWPALSQKLVRDILQLTGEDLKELAKAQGDHGGPEPLNLATCPGRGGRKLADFCHRYPWLKEPKQRLSTASWFAGFRQLAREWLAFWQALCRRRQLYPEDVIQSVSQAFGTWERQVESFLPGASATLVSGQHFWQTVGAGVLSQDVRQTGEPLAGVQIISLAESRNMPFAVAIVVGCQEGSFPKALPKDELIDDHLKRATGLPGWRQLEAMEDLSFYLLRQRMGRLVLLSSQVVAGDDQVRSRFVESLLAANTARLLTPAACQEHGILPPPMVATAPQLSPITASSADQEGFVEQNPQTLVTRVAATSLKRLLQCPYHYLLRHRNLEAVALPPTSEAARIEGAWLHRVMEAFIQECQEPSAAGTATSAASFYQSGLVALMRLTATLGPGGIASSGLYLQLKAASWPRWLSHLWQIFAGPPQGCLTEWRWPDGVLWPLGGYDRELVGCIDRYDTTNGMQVITDYKRRLPPTLADVKAGLEPQLALYAYAACTAKGADPERLLVGYWNIIDGKWQPCAVGAAVRADCLARGLVARQTPEVTAIIAALEDSWHRQEQRIATTSRFFAEPGNQQQHCRYCDFAGICRRDDPQGCESPTPNDVATGIAPVADAMIANTNQPQAEGTHDAANP